MYSIRTRITLMTVCAILVSVSIATIIGAISLHNLGNDESRQMLLQLCRTGEMNLDSYHESVEQSVKTVSTLVQESLEGIDYEQLEDQVERARPLFENVANQTTGVLTYYFRIDPAVSDTVKGFWYTNLEGEGFEEHEPTDITLYDTDDTSSLVWFTVPKATGEPVWLPPYVTDNLDVRVISYNVPVYWNDQFLGVIGIELDYKTMAQEVDHIRLYENGYAFVTDTEGNIVYHPYIDAALLTVDNKPAVPDGLLGDDTFVHYKYDGVEKEGVWLPLDSGMRLYVTVPSEEINRQWIDMIWLVVVVSVVVLVAVSLYTMRHAGKITKPLRELTAAAEKVDNGDYDFSLDYDKKDEVGVLTGTFIRLVEHLRTHINELNKRVYVDALTSVRNKGAFDNYLHEIQEQMNTSEETVEYAIGVFDCDNLKKINDQYGHDKGNIYLKAASSLICRVFQHSPVFRIGGDEFAVILQNEDYKYRKELLSQFSQAQEEICNAVEKPWEKVSVTVGIAVYDPVIDNYVSDTERRADKAMYDNKRKRKEEKRNRES